MGEVEDAQTSQRPCVSFLRGGVLSADRRRRLCAARARRVVLTRRESLRGVRRARLPGRVAEAVGRAGAAHGDVAEAVGLPPSARFQLRILGHLVHRQHPAVGRMALLRLEEELLDVARGHPVAQRLHEAVDVVPAIGRFLVLRVEQILLRLLLDEPDQLIVEVRRRRHHDAAALGRHHLVGVRPVPAAAPLQHRAGGIRQLVLVDHPHEHVLQARGDALVNGDRAVVAEPRAPLAMEGGEHGDGRVGAGEDEVQLAEGLQRRRVGIAGGGDGAAKRAGDEIRRQEVPPRPVRAERRRFDHHQLRTPALRGSQVGGLHGEAAGASEHRVRLGHQVRQPRLAVRRARIERDHAAAAGEEGMPQRRTAVVHVVLHPVEMRPAPPQRVAVGRFRAHHVRAEVRQELGAVDAAFVGEVEDADCGQCARQIGFPHADGAKRPRL